MKDLRHTHTSSEEEPQQEKKGLRFCKHCEAYNPEPGQCVNCWKSLGSYKVALISGLISTVVYGLFWITLTVILRIQLPILAGIFGAFISFGVSHYSRGRGILFQCIATIYTLIGIFIFDTLAFILAHHFHGTLDLQEWSLVQWYKWFEQAALYDTFTLIFVTLGVMSGFWIWRHD